MKAIVVLAAFSLAATAATAQDAAQPLNLRLPAGYAPAPAGSTATAPAGGAGTKAGGAAGTANADAATAAAAAAADDKALADPKAPSVAPKNGTDNVAVTRSRPYDPPGTYYGDTSGRMAGVPGDDGAQRCDDATYNDPQVHGSISTGIVSSSRGGSGNYQAGAVNVSKAFGSCEHPSGGVSISVGAGQGHFGGGRWGR